MESCAKEKGTLVVKRKRFKDNLKTNLGINLKYWESEARVHLSWRSRIIIGEKKAGKCG